MFILHLDRVDVAICWRLKMYTIEDVVHSMTWPSLVVVICALFFLRIQTRRHKLTLRFN